MARLRSSLDRANALAIHRGTQPVDPYQGYTDKIPVKYGHKSFVIPIEQAKKLKILPNDRLAAGDLAEIFGEAAEITVAAALEAQRKQYGMTYFGLLTGDEEVDILGRVIPEEKLKLTRLRGDRKRRRDVVSKGLENRWLQSVAGAPIVTGKQTEICHSVLFPLCF